MSFQLFSVVLHPTSLLVPQVRGINDKMNNPIYAINLTKNTTIHMRRILRLLFGLLWLCVATPSWADDYEFYIVSSSDGTCTSLDMAHLRSLSFKQTIPERNVYINEMFANYADGTSVTYDLAGYSALIFENPLLVGIDGVAASSSSNPAGNPFVYNGSQLTASSAGILRIHRLDGRQVSALSVSSGERVSLQTLPAGIYIVSLNGHAAKIAVK